MNPLPNFDFIKTSCFNLIFFAVTLPLAISAYAQDAPVEKQSMVDTQVKESVSKPEAPNKVDVKPEARDEEIAKRLSEILDATQWFNEPAVKVDQGVVFLKGQAKQDEYKTWASDLASNTQDVAAVVNRMAVNEKSIWDFSAAFTELREFRTSAIQAIPLAVFGFVILCCTWLLARLTGWLGNRAFTSRIPNSLLRWVATRAIMLPILIFGIYLVLRISGLTQLALTVLGGTGLIGLVIGIAFQDIAENFLASILISVQKPFRVGDLISIDGHEGIVQRVTTRGTTLLTASGNHVQIPNSKIYKTTIENFTANPLRRISFEIGIGYDDSTSDAQRIVLEKIKAHSATLNDPPPRVLISNLGASTVNLTGLVWIDGTKNDLRSVRSSCMRIAKQALLQAGISLPDEAREVIFPNGVPVSMNGKSSQAENPARDLTHSEDDPSDNHAPRPAQTIELDASAAEGNMTSDRQHLKKQAEQSWLPGEGEEVLVGEE